MKNLEPLLKEKEEKFYFVNENEPKKGNKNKTEIIVTSVISVIILWLMWYSLYPFYVGFVHYDEGHESTSDINKVEEDISSDSALITELYSYIDTKNNNELANLFVIYGDYTINNEVLTNEQKLISVFRYLGVTCDGNEIIKSLDEIKSSANKIFNGDSFVSLIVDNSEYNFEGYNVVYNAMDNNYTIKLNSCPESNDFTFKKLLKATQYKDEIYIYEAFGYFVNALDNKYIVYDNALKTNSIGEYVDENGNREFNEIDQLRQYKWTFKKSSDNNYYFVSVTPVI